MIKTQSSLITLILLGIVIIIFVSIFLMFYFIENNSGITYSTSPYILNKLSIFNFTSQQSTCSFDFSYSLNEYSPGNQSNLYFILNNGVKIIPEYNNYSLKISEITSNLYSYIYTQNKQTSYNSSVCTSIAQSIDKGYYVKYIERELSDGFYIVQPTSQQSIFTVNDKNTNPVTLLSNNTVYLDGSFISDSGIVTITNQNGKEIPNNPFTLGEYVYLPTGNYTISYYNDSNPVVFMYWNYSGGIIMSNPLSSTTNIMVLNNGKIFANLRSTIGITQYFNIYSNKTYALEGTKMKIAVEPPIEKGFYTFYVDSQPYSGCIHETNGICNITESVAGNYTITATFENATQYAVSYPITVEFYIPPYVILTGSYFNGNVSLYATAKGGYGTNLYTFYYANDTPINGCQNIQSSTCKFENSLPSSGVKINIYNPAPASFNGPNGAQIELQPNLKALGIQSSIGYDRFFENSTELYSWCESNCSSNVPNVWVNIPGGIGANKTAIITLNGIVSISEEYKVSITNGGGSATNSTSVTETSKEYPYFSGHMGSKTQNNDIGNVMNHGLVWNIYSDGTSGTSCQSPNITALYEIPLISGETISSAISGCGGVSYTDPYGYYYTPISGITEIIVYGNNVGGQTENYVVFDNQTGYQYGNYNFGNLQLAPNNNNPTYLIKALGFVVLSQATTFYEGADDGITLGLSNSTTSNINQWVGSTSSSNVTNEINKWITEGLTYYNSSIINPYTYRIEMLYFENGVSPAADVFYSNEQPYYYSPTPYPNNQAPQITYG